MNLKILSTQWQPFCFSLNVSKRSPNNTSHNLEIHLSSSSQTNLNANQWMIYIYNMKDQAINVISIHA